MTKFRVIFCARAVCYTGSMTMTREQWLRARENDKGPTLNTPVVVERPRRDRDCEDCGEDLNIHGYLDKAGFEQCDACRVMRGWARSEVARAKGYAERMARGNKCVRMHDMSDPENIYWRKRDGYPDSESCMACKREDANTTRDRKRALAAAERAEAVKAIVAQQKP